MPKLLRGLLIGVCLWLGTGAPLFGQPPPAEKAEREPPAVIVPYTVAGIGALVVMLLVCLPVRRE